MENITVKRNHDFTGSITFKKTLEIIPFLCSEYEAYGFPYFFKLLS